MRVKVPGWFGALLLRAEIWRSKVVFRVSAADLTEKSPADSSKPLRVRHFCGAVAHDAL